MNVPLRQYARVLRRYLGPQWPKVVLLAALLLGGTALQLISPQLLRHFIDTALAGGDEGTLSRTALAFLGMGVLTQVCAALATYVANDVGWAATNRLRADLALHCLRLDLPFHNQRTPGELIERIDGDVNALANFFSAFMVRILGSVLLVLGVLAILAREDWRAGLLLGAFATGTFFLLRRSQVLAVPANKAERETSARLMGFLEERLSGIDDIRANGAGDHTMRRYFEANREWFARGQRAWMLRAVMWIITMSCFAAANALAMGLGYVLFDAGRITIGTVFLLAHYTEMLLGPLERITNELQDLQRASASLERVEELQGLRPTLPEGEGAPLPAGPLAVEFDGVTFVYPDAPAASGEATSGGAVPGAAGPAADAVLHDVSFRLEPGRVLGLLGRTGSGKTTATRLLVRLYDPTAGAIRVGGVDLRAPHLSLLRRRVGIVTQDVQLFSGTVRDNLTLFDPDIPDARILATLEDLGMMAWLRSLPDGLDTELGSAGRGLSAGEAQLLAFTRAFLADPSVVILDEASSRLDPATERLIERAVDKLLQGRTALVIAHRLATVQRADQILVLEDGRVREHGDRAALAANPATRYADLLRTGLAEVLV